MVRYILLTTLFANGTLTANHFDGQKWKGPKPPTLSDSSLADFTSVALTPVDGLKFFGLTPDGEIKSYNVDPLYPLQWKFNGSINTGGF